jgi:hypothetical protein
MIKDATVNRGAVAPATFLSGVARDPNSDSIVHGVLKLLFAPDVSLRCLDRGVPKQEPNLFEFAAAIMAESGTGAPKVVRCQIGYSGLPGTPLDRIPDYVRRHARFLPLSQFRNSSEYSPFAHAGVPEPSVQKLLGP